MDKILNEGTGQKTEFDYDVEGNLLSADYNGVETIYKMPDAIGNLFKSPTRSDRKYNKGGKLVEDETYFYEYDEEGNLQYKTERKAAKPKVVRSLLAEDHERAAKEAPSSLSRWTYHWYGNGMLKGVVKPSGEHISFEYDALGRRTAKINHTAKSIYRYIWDGNVILHEWKYALAERPSLSVNEKGELSSAEPEPTENIVTWVYEEGSFVPSAKLVGKEKYSIISDYIGKPTHAYNSLGDLVWSAEYDIYGDLRNFEGDKHFIPFRQLGQYEDTETGLYYNRFRYYSPDTGTYISSDPIGLAGDNPNFYAYVADSNTWTDAYGLSAWKSIDAFRKKVKGLEPLGKSVPIKGDGNGTVAFTEVNGQKVFGVNSTLVSNESKELGRKWRKETKLTIGKDQALFHAEGHSLMRAYEKFGSLPSNLNMFVDRDTCANCRKYLPVLMEALGIEELTIHQKNGKSIKLESH